MVRGADYDNGVPQSDNAIDAGKTKAHGTGATVCPSRFDRSLELDRPDMLTLLRIGRPP